MTRHNDIQCPTCGKTFKSNFLRRHLLNEHGLTDVDWIILSEQSNSRKRFDGVPIEIVERYLRMVYDKDGSIENMHNSQFSVFYRIVSHCRGFRDSDYDNFFANVLPWQLEHPKTVNSRQLCRLCHHDSDELANKAYAELMLVKNPYYNHGGKFSPFSKNFVGYS